jgi:hypothetical protein
MRIHAITLAAGLGAVLFLSACADTRDALGLTNTPPDEFAVVDHPPLSMPPDFALRPPTPGVESPRGDNPSEKAAKALYGDDNMELVPQQGVSSLNVAGLSGAEQALIQQSGAAQADRTIRTQLDRESNQQVLSNRKLIDELLFWRKPKQTGTIVDPIAEAERLKAARMLGKPVTAGATTGYNRGKETEIQ